MADDTDSRQAANGRSSRVTLGFRPVMSQLALEVNKFLIVYIILLIFGNINRVFTVVITPEKLLCPRPVGGAGALSGDRRPSSVCLMSRTSALTRKPKGLGRRNFAQGFPRSHATPTLTSRSKVKVTGSINAAQRNVPIFRKRIKLCPSNLVRT